MKCPEALRAFASALAMSEAYLRTLDSYVFKCVPLEDKKTIQTWKKSLLGHGAFLILQVLWKESKYVSDSDLEKAGLRRFLPMRDLTVHKLAEDLAATPAAKDALNKRISGIVRAGMAYGLVEERKLHAKLHVISGSEKLHVFMLMTAQEWVNVLGGPPEGGVLT